MTTDENLAQLERAARMERAAAMILAQSRKQDREEYVALWRDTQRQLTTLATGMVDLQKHVSDLAVETRLRICELADEMREADAKLSARIDSLVSAIGVMVANQGGSK